MSDCIAVGVQARQYILKHQGTTGWMFSSSTLYWDVWDPVRWSDTVLVSAVGCLGETLRLILKDRAARARCNSAD